MKWSSEQYTKFESERNRPIYDLLAQIPDIKVERAADVGCGPGNSTELLLKKYPAAKIIGLDSSKEMIDAARTRLPNLDFKVESMADWATEEKYQVILSNAALQWVPDHLTLIPKLISKLSPGGILAIQVPDNLNEPAHVLMREVASSGSWSKTFGAESKHLPRHDADWYYQNFAYMATHINLWKTTYYHVLQDGPAAVVEWFKGTGLRPYLTQLDDSQKKLFLEQYQEVISKAYPTYPDGSVLLPFPRLFITITK